MSKRRKARREADTRSFYESAPSNVNARLRAFNQLLELRSQFEAHRDRRTNRHQSMFSQVAHKRPRPITGSFLATGAKLHVGSVKSKPPVSRTVASAQPIRLPTSSPARPARSLASRMLSPGITKAKHSTSYSRQVCAARKGRRAVLFANDNLNSSGGGRARHTERSKVKC